MTIQLPKAIQTYFEADRTGSPDAVAAAFVESGVVKDKGKTYRGRGAIREWMVEAGQLYTYTVEPFFIGTEGGKTQVTAHVAGTFPGSPIDLRFFFLLADDKVSELEVTV